MPPTWTPEIVVSAALTRSLVESQFPQLAPASLKLLGEGFDNTAFLVNREYVFRFPRRQFAVQFNEAETRVMPSLAPRLPLPVPIPKFVGQATAEYPWPFLGHRLIPGRTACAIALNVQERCILAKPLAQFLAALHAIPAAELGAGPDPIAKLDIVNRAPRCREDLHDLARRGLSADIRPLLAILDAAPAQYTPRADTLVHGDLYVRHLLVDANNQLAGVIDWGDVHLGDPAVDLAIAHAFLPPAARDVFRRAYGRIEDITWQMARLRGLWHTVAVVAYANDVGDADLIRAGQVSLRNLAAE